MRGKKIMIISGLVVAALVAIFLVANSPLVATVRGEATAETSNSGKMAERVKKIVAKDFAKRSEAVKKKSETAKDSVKNKAELTELYLSGGCFWGVEAYFEEIAGVSDVTAGYANGKSEETSYEQIAVTGHAEAVNITYDEKIISSRDLMLQLFKIINPIGSNSKKSQYRVGIYYLNDEQKQAATNIIAATEAELNKPVTVIVEPLKNYVLAEEYHQDYNKKHPNAYCSFDGAAVSELYLTIDQANYVRPSDQEIKETLSPEAYAVTQLGIDEPAYSNKYWDFYEPGIYVDVVTGEPLFSSDDKYDSQCGWAGFTKPIASEVLNYKEVQSFNLDVFEVRSRVGNSFLGNVFTDGPKDRGGLRFCIDSNALVFIPKKEMAQAGYEFLLKMVK